MERFSYRVHRKISAVLAVLILAGCDTSSPPESAKNSVPLNLPAPVASKEPAQTADISPSAQPPTMLRVCEPLTGKKVLADLAVLDPLDWSIVDAADVHPRKDCDGYLASSQPPVYAPLGDGKHFVLAQRLRYRLGTIKRPVYVPRGFVTDLASIPPVFWSTLPRDGNYVSAAIVHDYLYWDQRCTRAQADLILRNEMIEFGVKKKDVFAIYTAVHAGGENAWKKNAAEKKDRIRIIPQAYLDKLLNEDLNASRTLAAIEREMLHAGVMPMPDSENPDMADICSHVAVR